MVHQEAADKFVGADRHHLLPIVIGVVFPAKLDAVIVQGNQAVVGDGDPVRVASEVVEHLLRAGKRRLRIHNPLLLARRSKMLLKGIAASQGCEASRELQSTRVKGVIEQFKESTTIKARQNSNGQKEAGPAVDPASLVRRQAAPRHDAMKVRVV